MKRRHFITVVGTIITGSIAGCSSDGIGSTATQTPTSTSTSTPTPTPRPDQDNDGVPDVEDDFPENPNFSVLVEEQNMTVEINEDEYHTEPIVLEEDATVSYDATLRSGPDVEIFILSADEYEQYRSGNNFLFEDMVQINGVTASSDVALDSGAYYMVIDNTDSGEIQPPSNLDDDVAEVEFGVLIAR